MTAVEFAKYFDHTLLAPTASDEAIAQVCNEAVKYGFASVCVNSTRARLCASLLRGTDVKPCVTISFPFGQTTVESKLFECSDAIENGALELDYVINIPKLLARDFAFIESEMGRITELCHDNGAKVKVIFETCYLDQPLLTEACAVARNVRPDFIKTSTGYGSGGATAEAVRCMKQNAGDFVKVKASGGIRTLAAALTMIEAGADRIGASAGVKIMDEFLALD